MFNVELFNYGEYTRANGNTVAVRLRSDRGDLVIYFSYQTAVAVQHKGKTTVRENIWGTTTGKHLNWIDNGKHAERVDTATFDTALFNALARFGVSSLPLYGQPMECEKCGCELDQDNFIFCPDCRTPEGENG